MLDNDEVYRLFNEDELCSDKGDEDEKNEQN